MSAVRSKDWPAMQQRLDAVIDQCRQTDNLVQKQEALDFLRWLGDDNFLFLGHRYYRLEISDDGPLLRFESGSGLGTFRDEPDQARSEIRLSPRIAELALSAQPLVLTKSYSRSTVQRPSHLDYIGVKHYDDQGRVIGESRFFGLYSSQAYSTPVTAVPLLRDKVSSIWQQARLKPASHSGKTLKHIIDNFPRDEMLLAEPEALAQTIFGILECQERRRLRIFIRPDSYGRFITALVYVPRERYNTELRLKMQQILQREFNGHSVEFNVLMSEQLLAQIQFTIHSRSVLESAWDAQQIEAQMTAAMLSWHDNLHLVLVEKLGEAGGNALARRFQQALPAAYREDVSPRAAVADLQRLDALTDARTNSGPLSTRLYRPMADFDALHFRVLGRGELMALSDILPILEQIGVKVLSASPYPIRPQDGAPCWVLDFRIASERGLDANDSHFREQFQQTFVRAYHGEIDSDGFNALVIAAGLGWRPVTLLRAMSKYLLQLGLPFSQSYMQQTLLNNSTITAQLVQLFELRFDPARQTEQGTDAATQAALLAQIEQSLEQVANLDEDRILRHFLSLIQAMLRTNYYQQDSDGEAKAYLAFKFAPEQIPAAPMPRPKYEIFVYAPWVEGVHMRGGKVARGGLRWSDRREDFRTEVLGLVKAQMVKNAVIVPLGAKGGFVPKQLPDGGDRDAIQAEVIRSYRTFISALLDITDNLIDGNIVAPEAVVRHDDDDPYLVVAADKGTATFSDIANAISQDYGFWLGDAFASGGSQGYDHKKMGITARGAWESVKRLFRERGHDTQTSEFRVVGIGDMGGDVFGNGMLLSDKIRLVAAFNHQHIFIDPNPDAAASFAERQRLFALPRSGWQDYDLTLISTGGGIFERCAKSISLSPEIRQALAIDAKRLTPNALIQAILKAPVELLWNGGIGTYVKASHESHAQVGDRANRQPAGRCHRAAGASDR